MAELWYCPKCSAPWAAAENQGRCHNCLYGYETADSAILTGSAQLPLYGANGQVVQAQAVPTSIPSQQAGPPLQASDVQRYQMLLKGVQQMLVPVVQWLQQRGITVQNPIEAIPRLLQYVEMREQAYTERQRTVVVQPDAQQRAPFEARLSVLEQAVQQLALAVASLQPPHQAVPSVPQAPLQPYETFILTDQDAARLEREIMQRQQGQPHGPGWAAG